MARPASSWRCSNCLHLLPGLRRQAPAASWLSPPGHPRAASAPARGADRARNRCRSMILLDIGQHGVVIGADVGYVRGTDERGAQATSSDGICATRAHPGCWLPSWAPRAHQAPPAGRAAQCRALLAGHVHHVQANHQRHIQRHQLGHQIEAALKHGCVDNGGDDMRALGDDVLAGDQSLPASWPIRL